MRRENPQEKVTRKPTKRQIQKALQEGLKSKDGLVVFVGSVHGKPVNKTTTIRGEVTAVSLKGGSLLGFHVVGENQQDRTYLTRTPYAINKFLEWVKNVLAHGVNQKMCRPSPSGIARFDCPT